MAECERCGEVEKHPYHVYGCPHHCDAPECTRVPSWWSHDRTGMLEQYCEEHSSWCTGRPWTAHEMGVKFVSPMMMVQAEIARKKKEFEERYGWTGSED